MPTVAANSHQNSHQTILASPISKGQINLISLFCWCREGGSNPHDRKGRRILSPLRLPVPPSRQPGVAPRSIAHGLLPRHAIRAAHSAIGSASHARIEATVMTPASSAVVPEPVAVTPELLAQHSITPDEYECILAALGRVPSLTELGIYSVMWSEHCSYKSSRVHLRRLPT